MTGAFNQNGKETMAGARLYMQEHGATVVGRKIEIVLKDDASVPDVGKRLAQELIVNDKVALLLGGITPSALSIAPLTVEAKIPMVVMVSGPSMTVERSPYIVRTSFTIGQSSSVIADWSVKNGAKKIVTMVNDWAPGRGDEGHEVGKPARTDLHRPRNARHRAERIYPQSRDCERRNVQCRIRDDRGREGSPARRQEVSQFRSSGKVRLAGTPVRERIR